MLKRLLKQGLASISKDVETALRSGTGVVALESTVVTHGLPHAHNLRTAEAMEAIIRSEGATPATIALRDGKIRIGLTNMELQELAESSGAVKVSERDIAATLVKGCVGGTTVAATSLIADWAGIHVFATGGIGGVHRGAESSWDVSADLRTLGRVRVAVVCAGAKSILDIPKTLEVLETSGVPVIAFADSDAFPGFFTADSGSRAPLHSPCLHTVARIIQTDLELGLPHGTLVACPIPPADAEAGAQVEAAVQTAIREAKERGIKSREVTPYILARVNELTKGASMLANIALLKNNARIGAQLAIRLQELRSFGFKASSRSKVTSKPSSSLPPNKSQPDVVVVGGSNLDVYLDIGDAELKVYSIGQDQCDDTNSKLDGGSIPGTWSSAAGGVGRNTADALSRLGTSTRLVSALGGDEAGRRLTQLCAHMDRSGLRTFSTLPTPTYTALLQGGNVRFGVQSGMDTLESLGELDGLEESIASARLLFLDGNISIKTIAAACNMAERHRVPVWFDPADASKMRKIFDAGCFEKISFASPNLNEFAVMLGCLGWPSEGSGEELLLSLLADEGRLQRLAHVRTLVVTMGGEGVALLHRTHAESAQMELHKVPAPSVKSVVSVSGAGDCFNAGFVNAWLGGLGVTAAAAAGRAAAGAALASSRTVPETLGD